MSDDEIVDFDDDQISMSPAAIEVRNRMTKEWAQRTVPQTGGPRWVIDQHFEGDVPAMLGALTRIVALETSRIGAGEAIGRLVEEDSGTDVAFYAGVSFALAKVRAALIAPAEGGEPE